MYLLDDKKYRNYFKKGIIKYIPDLLLPKYRPKILDTIYIDEKIIGYIMGNNLKEIDFKDLKEVDTFISNLHKINNHATSTIYIEGCHRFSKGILDYIEKKSGYKFASGDKIRSSNIELFLKKASKLLKRDLHKNDLLIICNDKNKLIDTIKILPKELNCIANIGIDEDNLYENVLEETGVSIYQPYKIDKAIKNFHFIINYSEEIFFDLVKIRNQAIVMDFSRNRSIGGLKQVNKKIIYIEDFNFPSKLDSRWIDGYIDSMLYETIYASKLDNFRQIYVDDSYYYLDDYLSSKIKRGGRL